MTLYSKTIGSPVGEGKRNRELERTHIVPGVEPFPVDGTLDTSYVIHQNDDPYLEIDCGEIGKKERIFLAISGK